MLDNSFWLFSDQLFRMGTALVVGVWVARRLGPDNFGMLSYAVAVVGFVSSFASLGLSPVIVREVVRNPGDESGLLSTAFLLRSFGASVGFLVCVAFGWMYSPSGSAGVAVVVVTAVGLLLQVTEVYDLALQARRQPRVSCWIRIAASALASLMKVLLIQVGASLPWFAGAGVLEIAVSGIGWWAWARRAGVRLAPAHVYRADALRLLAESWPLALSSIAIYAQAYADQLVLAGFAGVGELGQYSAALRLVSAFGFIPMVIQTVAAPDVTRARLSAPELYHKRLHAVYRTMFCSFVAVGVPLAVAGPYLVQRFFGSSYQGAAALVPLLAARLFFTNFGVARSIYITTEGLFKFALFTAVVGAVLNVGLNMCLVPMWGARGAIVSSLISFGVTTFALEPFNSKTRVNLSLMLQAILLPFRSLSRPRNPLP